MHLCPTEQGEHLSIPHLNSSPLGLFRVKQKLRKSFLDEQILVFRIFNMISSIVGFQSATILIAIMSIQASI